MRKSIFLVPITIATLALFAFASCSSDKTADEPQIPNANEEPVSMVYSAPSYKTTTDINWLDAGEAYIECKETLKMICDEHGETTVFHDFDKSGRFITIDFSDEISGAKIVGAWTLSDKSPNIKGIDTMQPTSELEIERAGRCKITGSEITFDVNGPSLFEDGCTSYTIGIYYQGLKNGKDARGQIVLHISRRMVGNTTLSVGKYFIDNEYSKGFSIDGENLTVPASGGKIGLRLDNRRTTLSIEVTSDNQKYKSYQAIDEFFSVSTPNATYSLSEITGYLNIEFKPNTSGTELTESLHVVYDPLYIETIEGCMYGIANLKITQAAK